MVAKKFLAALVVLMLSVSAFAQEMNLNIEPDPKERYEHFTKMKKAGTGMIIGGAIIGGTGSIMSAVHLVKADDYVAFRTGGHNYFRDDSDMKNYDKEIEKAAGWFIGSYVGYSVMLAGIPIRIVGRIKANQWKSKMPNSAYIVPNGVKLTWNF